MITIELTPHEFRFIYGNILQKLAELQDANFVDGRPNPNIESVIKEIELLNNFSSKLLKVGKNAADEQFALEKEEKQKFTNGTFETQLTKKVGKTNNY